MKCNYNDCGWCYAPQKIQTNADNGECNSAESCPYFYSIMITPEKPTPPGPRLIREDLLLSDNEILLDKFRIVKAPIQFLSGGIFSYSYTVQEKRFFGWKTLGFEGDIKSFFYSYSDANKALYNFLFEKYYTNLVEYLPVDFSIVNNNPNPPPKNP